VTVVQPILEFCGIVAAVYVVHSDGAGVITASTCAALLAGCCGMLVVVRSAGRRELDAHAEPATMASIRAYGWPMFLVAISFTLFGQVDQLVIYAVRGAHQAAGYIGNWRLITLLHLPGLAAASVVSPRLAAGATQAKRRLFASWLLLLGVGYIGVAATTAAVATWLVPLGLGGKYVGAAQIFVALTAYSLLLGIAPLVTVAANFLGGARRRVRLGAVTIVTNLALDLALVPKLGVYGAAIGTSVAFTWYVGAHLTLSWRLLGGTLRGSTSLVGDAHLARWLGAALLVLAVTALAWLTSRAVGTATWHAGGGNFGAALAGGSSGFALFAGGAYAGARLFDVRLHLSADAAPPEDHDPPGADERSPSDGASPKPTAPDESPTTEEGAA
jgi:O-antigen/teichoic acid export membrane protein